MLKFLTVKSENGGTVWNDLFGWVARKTPPFSKMNMTAHFRIANLYHNKSQEFWINVLCTEDTKGEIFGCSANHVWPEENTAYQHLCHLLDMEMEG